MVTNGIVSSPTTTTYLSTVNVTCNAGHSVIGSSDVTCQADKKWSAPGTCESKFHILCKYSEVTFYQLSGFVQNHTYKMVLFFC